MTTRSCVCILCDAEGAVGGAVAPSRGNLQLPLMVCLTVYRYLGSLTWSVRQGQKLG